MPSQTVVDRLVVEFGLDPKKFTQGQKEVVKGLKEMEAEAKDTGQTMEKAAKGGDSALLGLGKRVLTVAAIFKVLSYTTKNILEQSRAVYDLANASRVLGERARNLRNFENIAEIMGGTAEGARRSIQGLKQAIFDLTFNGQMSQQLVQLGRLGVQFQDSRGRARDFKDVYLDTATALQRGVQSGQMSEADALMFAESAGFDPGLARAMVGGRDAAALALAKQEARRQISDEDVRGATSAEQAIASAGQAKATAFTAAGTAGGFATAQRTAESLEGMWREGATGDIAAAWDELTQPVQDGMIKLAEATGAATRSLWGMARTAALGKGPAAYTGAIKSSAAKHGVPEHILAGVIGAESNFDPYAKSSAGAVGIAQLMPQYYENAGKNPIDDIDTAAGILASNYRIFGGDWDKALMAYNGGARRVKTSNVFGDGSSGRDLAGETIAYPGRVYDAASTWQDRYGSPGGDTNVQIDSITVNTAATDAGGIANDIGGAMKRKLTAAQADGGQN